jgi:hypothetical protein
MKYEFESSTLSGVDATCSDVDVDVDEELLKVTMREQDLSY